MAEWLMHVLAKVKHGEKGDGSVTCNLEGIDGDTIIG